MLNIPARFNQSAEETKLQPIQESETAKIVVSPPVSSPVVEEPAAPTLPAPPVSPTPTLPEVAEKPVVRTKGVKKAKLMVGDHALPVRGSSGYRILCAFLSEWGKFGEIGKLIQTTDVSYKDQAQKLINAMLIPMNVVEEEMRKRPDWIRHCEHKFDQIMERSKNGSKRAFETLNNQNRVQNGKWLGNIREMICSSIGSSSPKAKNRNINKFRKAGLAVIQFPRRPKKGQPFSVALIADSDLEKVIKAFETVYGGFKLKPSTSETNQIP